MHGLSAFMFHDRDRGTYKILKRGCTMHIMSISSFIPTVQATAFDENGQQRLSFLFHRQKMAARNGNLRWAFNAALWRPTAEVLTPIPPFETRLRRFTLIFKYLSYCLNRIANRSGFLRFQAFRRRKKIVFNVLFLPRMRSLLLFVRFHFS